MKNVKAWLLLICLGACGTVTPQSTSFSLSFAAEFRGESVDLTDSAFSTRDSTNFQIDVIKFYVSGIEFLNNGRVVLAEKNSYHLIDATNNRPIIIDHSGKENVAYDQLRFYLGIDSTTNVSGAMGGDLDPTIGMYWTWQSGYINFKLEGRSAQCKSRNHEFQFHVGGYLQPFDCLQTVVLPANNEKTINIKLDLQKVLANIDLANQHHIMSPCHEAVVLSKILADSFNVIKHEN